MSVEEGKAHSAPLHFPRVRALFRRFERLVRYVIVGGGAAALYAGLVYMLLEYRVVNDAVLASALASLLSQPVAFVVHRAVTYRDAAGVSGAPFRYTIVVVSTFLISTGSMYLVTRSGWPYWFAIVTCWFLVPAANFLIGGLWVFRTKSILQYKTERSDGVEREGLEIWRRLPRARVSRASQIECLAIGDVVLKLASNLGFQVASAADQKRYTWQGMVVAGAYLAAGFLAGVGGMYVGEALLGATLILAFDFARRGVLDWRALNISAPLILFALMIAWFCLTRIWSPEADWRTSLGILLGLPVLASFPWMAAGAKSADREIILRAAVAGAFLAAALLVLQGAAHTSLFPGAHHGSYPATPHGSKPLMSRGGAVLAIVLWPVVAVLDDFKWEGIASAASAIAVTILVGILGHSSATLIAVGLGGVCYFAARAYPTFVIAAGGMGVSSAILAAPQLADKLSQIPPPMLRALPASYFHRVGIWENAAALIAQKPWFGWGLDASKTFKAQHDYGYLGVRSLIPLHPHNGALQIWLETGLVGAALVSALVLTLTLKLIAPLGRTPKVAAGSLGALGAFCVFVGVSFSVWQMWIWGSLAAAVGILCVYRRAVMSDGSAR